MEILDTRSVWFNMYLENSLSLSRYMDDKRLGRCCEREKVRKETNRIKLIRSPGLSQNPLVYSEDLLSSEPHFFRMD